MDTRGRRREDDRADGRRGEINGCVKGGEGKGKDRSVTSPHLPEQEPAGQNDGAGATNR